MYINDKHIFPSVRCISACREVHSSRRNRHIPIYKFGLAVHHTLEKSITSKSARVLTMQLHTFSVAAL